MGYMGFGMQKWIYSRNPKKPFSKGRIPSFTAVDTYEGKFKLQPSKPFGRFFIVFSILLLGLFFSIIYLKKDEFLIHSNKVHNQYNERVAQINKDAFKFLIKSGKNRLIAGNIVGAYSEFSLAHNIKPNDVELNQLLTETLSILCYNDTNYCLKLDVFNSK